MESSPGDRGDPSPGAAGDANARPTEITALLGRGTHFEGKLHFDGRVRVDGSFRGEIWGEDVLVIGEGALVIGEIQVATCIVTGGEVQANIRARDAIELYAPAKVVGALHAPAIFIDRGVQFEGSCKMAPLDEPAAIEAPARAEPTIEDAPEDMRMLPDEEDATFPGPTGPASSRSGRDRPGGRG